MMMEKKKGGIDQSKNNGLRGGKNTLPKKIDGTIDIKKIVKEGAQEQKKKWVDKKVVKNRPKQPKSSKPSPMAKPSTQKANGINRLKIAAKTNPKSKTQPQPKKDITKLKKLAPKLQPIQRVANSKVTPSKGVLMIKKSAVKIATPQKQVKRVKQPIIRRGR